MPIPNSTTISSEVIDSSTLKPMPLARSASTELDRPNTSPMEAMGSAAAMGLRKISPRSTTIIAIVTTATIFSADLNDFIVSYCMATMPASPARRPLPLSRVAALSRSTGTALCSLLSPGLPLKSTVTS